MYYIIFKQKHVYPINYARESPAALHTRLPSTNVLLIFIFIASSLVTVSWINEGPNTYPFPIYSEKGQQLVDISSMIFNRATKFVSERNDHTYTNCYASTVNVVFKINFTILLFE